MLNIHSMIEYIYSILHYYHISLFYFWIQFYAPVMSSLLLCRSSPVLEVLDATVSSLSLCVVYSYVLVVRMALSLRTRFAVASLSVLSDSTPCGTEASLRNCELCFKTLPPFPPKSPITGESGICPSRGKLMLVFASDEVYSVGHRDALGHNSQISFES